VDDKQGINTEYKVGKNRPPKEQAWKPGQSGNPKGRPKNTITTLLKEYLDADGEVEKQAIVRAWIATAKTSGARGHIPALVEMLDRTEGKVDANLKLKSDIPINLIFKTNAEPSEQLGDDSL